MNLTHLRNIALVFILGASFLLTSCEVDEICERGKGTAVTDTLFLPAFTGINLSIAADVYLTQDSVQSVEIIAQENIIDLVDLDVDSDGVWKIRYTSCTRKVSDVEIHISVPNLEEVKITGSGDIVGQNRFNVNNLILGITGSGDIHLDYDADDAEAMITGSGSITSDLTANSLATTITASGDMNFSGTVDHHEVKITGSGNVNSFELETQTTNVRITASGDAEVDVAQTLDVTISGSGSVVYEGNPQVTANITGSGEVRAK